MKSSLPFFPYLHDEQYIALCGRRTEPKSVQQNMCVYGSPSFDDMSADVMRINHIGILFNSEFWPNGIPT